MIPRYVGKLSNPTSVISEAVSTENLGTSRALSEESLEEDLEASQEVSDSSLASASHSEAKSLPGTLDFGLAHIPESPSRLQVETEDLEADSIEPPPLDSLDPSSTGRTAGIPPDSLDLTTTAGYLVDGSIPPDSLDG